jgi:acyl-coenzyme A synthetase/AMP-(fatty) acid ligase
MKPPELTSSGHYIAWCASHAPGSIAIVREDSAVSYRRLARHLARTVAWLKRSGIGPGMLVGTHLSRRYSQLLIMLGCEVAGAAAVALADTLSFDREILRHCDVLISNATPNLPDMPDLPRTIELSPDWLARLPSLPPDAMASLLERDIPPDEIVRVVRTSGTTGEPKAMPMTHKTWETRIDRVLDRLPPDILAAPRSLCLYNFNIGASYMRVLGVLRLGGVVYFASARNIASLVGAGAVNDAFITVGDVDNALKAGLRAPPGHKMHAEVFGSAVSLRLRQQVQAQLNANILNQYASNEIYSIAQMDDDNIGTLYPGVEVRILDDDGNDVPPGQLGRIRVRSETMVHEYFRDPKLTETCFIDGWFQTTDIGHAPAADKLIVAGRADDILNVGGIKVPPAPIEERIRRIEGVNDAAVLSVENDNGVGMLLVAIETADPANFNQDEQISAIIKPYKRPFDLMAMPAFPRTDTAKVKRHEIAAEYQRARGGSSS